MKKPSTLPPNVWRHGIQREDWDFSESACPNDLLPKCFYWEYRREMVQSEHGGAFPASCEQYPVRVVAVGKLSVVLSGFVMGPGFPRLSYLQDWRNAGSPNLYTADWRLLHFGLSKFLADYGDKPEHKARGEPIWRFGVEAEIELMPIAIPWMMADDKIVEAFRSWLKIKRPQGQDSRPRVDSPPIPRKPVGAAALHRQLRAGLKALGAWRLYQHHDGNWVKASLHPKAIEILGQQYNHEGPWYKAKKTVGKEIRRTRGNLSSTNLDGVKVLPIG
jgi:hypothetical protein